MGPPLQRALPAILREKAPRFEGLWHMQKFHGNRNRHVLRWTGRTLCNERSYKGGFHRYDGPPLPEPPPLPPLPVPYHKTYWRLLVLLSLQLVLLQRLTEPLATNGPGHVPEGAPGKPGATGA